MPTPSQLDASGDAIRQVIRAYHGSPYDFDKFDASKIGRGTGRQSYGHGLYFSESEPLAETYRSGASALHRTPQEDALELWRRQAEKLGDPQRGVLSAMDLAQERMEEAASMPMAQERWDDILQHLYNIDYRQPLPKKSGSMFEVEINAPKHAFLNYDNPFRSQAGVTAANTLEQAVPGAIDPDTLRGIQAGPDKLTVRSDNVERALAARRIRKFAENPNGAAELMKAGIPGIEYVDDSMYSSKSIPPATNYVMFPGTEDQIRILRKYGLMAPVAAGAASQYNNPNETPDPR
jgi:hypothetical protein